MLTGAEVGLLISAIGLVGATLHGGARFIKSLMEDVKSEIKSELHSEIRIVNHTLANIKAQQEIFSKAFEKFSDTQDTEKIERVKLTEKMEQLDRERRVG